MPMNMALFWYVARCSLVDIDRRFRRAYCTSIDYVAQHPRRQPASYWSPHELEISPKDI
jgi:hypothetical protein